MDRTLSRGLMQTSVHADDHANPSRAELRGRTLGADGATRATGRLGVHEDLPHAASREEGHRLMRRILDNTQIRATTTRVNVYGTEHQQSQTLPVSRSAQRLL